MSNQKSAHPFTPVVVCKVLRQMGLISNHDNGYFESALVAYLNHGDIGKAARDASDERDADMDRGYDDAQ